MLSAPVNAGLSACVLPGADHDLQTGLASEAQSAKPARITTAAVRATTAQKSDGSLRDARLISGVTLPASLRLCSMMSSLPDFLDIR
jgi:hypothetical protein